jgi:hypothetical protein
MLTPLPVPASSPQRPEAKFIVALVAWRTSRSGSPVADTEISQRYLAQLLRRSHSSSTRRLLDSMAKPDTRGRTWLHISQRGSGTKGHRYELGPAAAADAAAWVVLGEVLVGRDGWLTPLLGRPAIKVTGLGLTCSMALGALMTVSSARESDLRAALATFVSKPTARAASRRLKQAGLVEVVPDALRVVADLDLWLEFFEEERGLGDSARLQDRRLSNERRRYQVRLTGKSRLTTIKADLRSMDCVYCGGTPVAGQGTVEHFPPIRFGGSDQTSLLLPSCLSHNSADGAALRSVPAIETVDVHLPVDYNCPQRVTDEWIIDFMLLQHLLYVQNKEAGQMREARDRIERIWPMWLAHVSRRGRSVDPNTGELWLLGQTSSHELLLPRLVEHTSLIRVVREAEAAADLAAVGC